MNKIKIFKYLLFALIITIVFILVLPVHAEDFFYFRQMSGLADHDYVLESPSGEVKLTASAGSTSENIITKMLMIISRDRINNYFTYPSHITPASDLYFIKFLPYREDNFSTQPKVTIKYTPDNQYKQVYYYNWSKLSFEKLDVKRDTINKALTFTLPNKKSVMFAVFSEPEIVGKASWYVHPGYSGKLIAASRDFAQESKLLVTNLYNNKEVIVTVKDYGPKECKDWTDKEQEQMGPCQDRVLDLSKTAFLQLATTTGVGVISEVKVTPIK